MVCSLLDIPLTSLKLVSDTLNFEDYENNISNKLDMNILVDKFLEEIK